MTPARRAFTLVEMLTVVVIIAVLLGLLAPAISSGFLSAREAGCVAAARSFAQAVQVYAADNSDKVPAMRVVYPDETFWWNNSTPHVRYERPEGGFGLVKYEHQGWFASRVLAPKAYLASEDAKCPVQRRRHGATVGRPAGEADLPAYSIPEAFYFRNKVYETRGRWPTMEASFRVQRLSDVEFPSEKILVFERRAWHLPDEPSFFSVLYRGDRPTFIMSDGSGRRPDLTNPPPVVYNSALRYERPVPWLTPSGVGGSDLWR